MIGSSAPYDIVRREEACAATGRVFEPGERHLAVLIEQPEEETLARLLYSERAWESGHRPAAPARVFGFWRRIAGDETRPRSPIVSPEELFDLFEQLAESDQPRQISFRYLLALMLMRKRRLIYDGVVADRAPGESPVLRLKARPGGDEHLVIDPGMDEAAIAEATEQLGQVMQIDEDGA
jgi:hypothetical protein